MGDGQQRRKDTPSASARLTSRTPDSTPSARCYRRQEGNGPHRIPGFDFHVLHSGKEYLIEYHGAQHYGPVSFGGKKTSQPELQANFEAIQKRDEIKRSWCAKNELPLLVIPHTATDKEIIDMVCAFLQVTHSSQKPKMAEPT